MNAYEDKRRRLVEDVASLARVRTRFSMSSDGRLHSIMPALIPKLFQRLENYSTTIADGNEARINSEGPFLSASTLSALEKAQQDSNAIICSAMERLRGNTSISTDSLARSMLPFIDSENHTVGTWSLAFLQISIQRTPATNSSLVSTLIPALSESVGRLHQKIVQLTENSGSNSPLNYRWICASWLLLDSIVLHSGQKPMTDWGIETFDYKRIGRTDTAHSDQRRNNDQCLPCSYMLKHVRVTDSNNNQNTLEGLLYLILDLMLFWPVHPPSAGDSMMLSRLGMRRMQHRNDVVLPFVDDNDGEDMFTPVAGELERGLPLRIRRPRSRRRKTEWSESSKAYLRYMKLVCLEFAIRPPCKGLFHGGNNDRALLLSIVVADYESMHGRVALSYLNKWNAENNFVPLSVVASTLVLIVGEAQAREVLDVLEVEHNVRFSELVFGSRIKNESTDRPSIPWAATSRAANFLMENPFQWKDTADTMSTSDGIGDEIYTIIFIELSLKLSESDDDRYIFLAIRLISFFYSQLERIEPVLASKVFDAVTKVLTILVDFGVGDELRTIPNRGDQNPLGVPAPFYNRSDLNQLLLNHRQTLKRNQMKRDDAIQTRQEAYKLIVSLSSHIFEQTDTSPFHLPNLLIQCAVYEDRFLEHHVMKALDSTLAKYKQKLEEDQSLYRKDSKNYRVPLQQQATSILPALLEAVCSGAGYVRTSAIQWIRFLLINMDAEAASYLASHLVNDESRTIARIAQQVLEITANKMSPTIANETEFVSFFDLTKSDGLMSVQMDLENRSKELAQRLQISPPEQSVVLLLHHKFSVSKGELEYFNDRDLCLERCGLVFDDDIVVEENEGTTIKCGICYDGVAPESIYSLSCGHPFCKSCWVSYARESSNETASTTFLDLRCPHHNCGVRVMLNDLQRLDPCLIQKWKDALLRKFIEEDPSYRYCSGPDCGCVAKKIDLQTKTARTRISQKVTCDTCSTTFCFDCGKDNHTPASCEDMAQWDRIKGSSRFWIKHNAKPCPGCNVPIEKNTGCNHMKCPKCNADFCWLCLNLLNSHLEPHTCNRYDAADSAEDDFERQALFTVTRYDAHDAAAAFTANQYKTFEREKFVETYWFLDKDEDAETMVRALETLFAGRNFLKYSYVKTLFLKDPSSIKLYEDHHACLEMFTERLSQLTEVNLHRYYTLRGRVEIDLHFRRLAFYTASVTKYMERIECLK